jgi:hypothetical protein
VSPGDALVTVKLVDQQDMMAAHRVRELLVHQRTALINQVRGLRGERGITIAQSRAALHRAMPQILKTCEGELTGFCQTLMTNLLRQVHGLNERIAQAKAWIKAFMKRSALCKRSRRSTALDRSIHARKGRQPGLLERGHGLEDLPSLALPPPALSAAFQAWHK